MDDRAQSSREQAVLIPGHRALASRIVRRMLYLAAAVAVPYLVRLDFEGLAILTLTVAASIFHFRSLEAQVVALDARRGPPTLARAIFVSSFRYFLLAAGLFLIFFVDVARPSALILGVSTLPAALATEALVRLFRARTA